MNVHFNDLRDYHNYRFFLDRLEECLGILASKGVFAFLYSLDGGLDSKLFLSILLLFEMAVCDYNLISINNRKVIGELNSINKGEILKSRKILYSEIVENVSKRLNVNEIHNPTLINNYIYYLIKNGYLSINKKFDVRNVRDNDLNFGFNVIRGFGMCRNIAFLTTDIFKSVGYEAYNLYLCNCSNEGNYHAITMVVYDEKLYFFDNLNNVVFSKKNDALFIDGSPDKYVPFFTFPYSHRLNVFNRELINDDENIEKCMEAYNKYPAVKIDLNNKGCPLILKKTYNENKKLYKRFVQTYY